MKAADPGPRTSNYKPFYLYKLNKETAAACVLAYDLGNLSEMLNVFSLIRNLKDHIMVGEN